MGEVVEANMVTRLDVPVERVIRKAGEAGLEDVTIVGFDEHGEFYFASSIANGPEVLWRLHMAIKKLLDIGEGDNSR